MKADEVIAEVVKLCKSFGANEVILYGSRAKGTSRERSDIDIAVVGGYQAIWTKNSVDVLSLFVTH